MWYVQVTPTKCRYDNIIGDMVLCEYFFSGVSQAIVFETGFSPARSAFHKADGINCFYIFYESLLRFLWNSQPIRFSDGGGYIVGHMALVSADACVGGIIRRGRLIPRTSLLCEVYTFLLRSQLAVVHSARSGIQAVALFDVVRCLILFLSSHRYIRRFIFNVFFLFRFKALKHV